MISEKGKSLIKDFEGFRTHAYQDSVGVWTIGYGHTKGVTPDMVITDEQGEEMLAEELKEYETYVDTLVKVPLHQYQYDALVSWTYNLGPTKLKSSTMLRVLNEGNYEEVPTQMKRWDKAGGQVLAGLTKRREAEAAMFEGK